MAAGLARRLPLIHPRAMSGLNDTPRIRIRILFGEGDMIGPGKADLLELVAETGSIASAGRRMGMSYKRAWMLVEKLNAMFREPLVESTRGGPHGGGAALTDTGRRVLALYRSFEKKALEAASGNLRDIQSLLRAAPHPDGD
jgi:molybdate transport system regulatory protein